LGLHWISGAALFVLVIFALFWQFLHTGFAFAALLRALNSHLKEKLPL
jgi:hypothetical protein